MTNDENDSEAKAFGFEVPSSNRMRADAEAAVDIWSSWRAVALPGVRNPPPSCAPGRELSDPAS